LSEEENLRNDELTETGVEPVGDMEALQQALAEEKEKSEKYLANWQRTQADFVNYKRRTEQGKMEIVEFANSTLILKLLTVLDDFERAFDSLPAQLEKFSWIEGITLVYNKLKATLESQGLTEIKAKGEPFDTHLHEAVMRQEGEEEIVIEEIQKGYKLKNKVIRPSVVIVGKGKEKEQTEQERQKEE